MYIKQNQSFIIYLAGNNKNPFKFYQVRKQLDRIKAAVNGICDFQKNNDNYEKLI